VILELDVEEGRVSEHDVAAAPISALAVMSTGRLVVADRSGQLAVMTPPDRPARGRRIAPMAPRTIPNRSPAIEPSGLSRRTMVQDARAVIVDACRSGAAPASVRAGGRRSR
jgi:hypothetical protein